MRDDLDALGRRLWPTTDVLRPRQSGAAVSRPAPARGWWQLEPLATLAAALLIIAVIGGAVVLGRSLSSRTPVPAGPRTRVVSPPVVTAGPTASSSPSPTATPVQNMIVWAAVGSSVTTIRVGDAPGGFHTAATFPTGPTPSVLGAGGNRVLFWRQSNGHLYDVNIHTGAITDHGGADGVSFYGAAFSPDGNQVEYLRLTGPNTGQIRRLDFASGSVTGLQSFNQGPVDVPRVWTGVGIAASRQYLPFNDGPDPGFALLDPSTGARKATTDAPTRYGAWAIGDDGVHAAHAVGVPPAQPDPGTLDTEVIGSAAQVALRETTNHVIGVLAMSPDGSTVLFSDDPSMGGYAGVTLSPDYGLFTLSGGRRTQIAHYGGAARAYVTGAYLNNTDFVLVTTQGTLLRSVQGGSPTTLDTVAGSSASAGGSAWVVAGQ